MTTRPEAPFGLFGFATGTFATGYVLSGFTTATADAQLSTAAVAERLSCPRARGRSPEPGGRGPCRARALRLLAPGQAPPHRSDRRPQPLFPAALAVSRGLGSWYWGVSFSGASSPKYVS